MLLGRLVDALEAYTRDDAPGRPQPVQERPGDGSDRPPPSSPRRPRRIEEADKAKEAAR